MKKTTLRRLVCVLILAALSAGGCAQPTPSAVSEIFPETSASSVSALSPQTSAVPSEPTVPSAEAESSPATSSYEPYSALFVPENRSSEPTEYRSYSDWTVLRLNAAGTVLDSRTEKNVPEWNYGELSPDGKRLLVRTEDDSAGDGFGCRYMSYHLSDGTRSAADYRLYGDIKMVFLDNGLIAYAGYNGVGGQSCAWEHFQFYNADFEPAALTLAFDFGRALYDEYDGERYPQNQPIGIDYCAATDRYYVAYYQRAPEDERTGSDPYCRYYPLGVAVFNADGSLYRNVVLPEPYCARYNTNILGVDPSQPVTVLRDGSPLLAIMQADGVWTFVRVDLEAAETAAVAWIGERADLKNEQLFSRASDGGYAVIDALTGETVSRLSAVPEIEGLGRVQISGFISGGGKVYYVGYCGDWQAQTDETVLLSADGAVLYHARNICYVGCTPQGEVIAVQNTPLPEA